ncbi:response regulator transcription factor [Corallococcus silvisoli]|uniref:response regulator transcription factor n=1 Tax=Corallococcus silvisoli TaxID=2697031 RepID=UPI001376DD9D|nr:response regulator [Corallococcus silvisoli]NBD10188.1 response regulator [Corallococcus silvisoli]
MSRAPPPLLIVEDDSDLRDALVEILLAEGFTVAATASGDEAFAWLEAHPAPALVLLDMWTPRRDNWRLLDALHHLPRFADVPVVAISSRDEKHPAIRGVLSKPFDREALVASVRRYARAVH